MFHEAIDGLSGVCPQVGWGHRLGPQRETVGFGCFTTLPFEIIQTHGKAAKTVQRSLVCSSPRFRKHFTTLAPSPSVCLSVSLSIFFSLKCLRVEDRLQGWGAEVEEKR